MNEDNTKIEDGAQNKDVDSNTSNEEVKIEVILAKQEIIWGGGGQN